MYDEKLTLYATLPSACWNAPGSECAGFVPWTSSRATWPSAMADVSAASSAKVLVEPMARSAPNFTSDPTDPTT